MTEMHAGHAMGSMIDAEDGRKIKAGSSRLGVAITALVILASTAIALLAIFAFARAERDHELRTWQTRLGIIAETRATDVAGWVQSQYRELQEISENASVQLYMSELVAAQARGRRITDDLAESGYLQNFLTVIAHRAGYGERVAGPDVDANVEKIGLAGIALLSLDGKPVAATRSMPPIEGRVGAFVSGAERGERSMLDIHSGAAGTPSIGFLMPVFAVQADNSAARQIGWVLGVRSVDSDLFDRLHQPGVTWKSARAELVRQEGSAVRYLSPGPKGAAPLSRTVSTDTPGFAAAEAIRRPGSFGFGRDASGTEILFSARKIAAAPWTLVYRIDRSEALSDGDARVTTLVTGLFLAVALAVALALVVWRHGASVRARSVADRYEELAAEHAEQSRLLRLITDSQPGAIFIADETGIVRFANRFLTDRFDVEEAELDGKSLASVFGPAASEEHLSAMSESLKGGNVATRVVRSDDVDDPTHYQVLYVPLEAAPGFRNRVLVIENDVTHAVAERARHERALDSLLGTLLQLVDQRDPFAANQSAQVAAVARSIAEEAGLESALVDKAATAGRLLNVGKALVPTDVLTRDTELSDDEMQEIRESLSAAIDVLARADFDSEVIAILRRLQGAASDGGDMPDAEHSGPEVGENLSVAAEAVRVANTFVAMVSPRAWRDAVPMDQAISTLLGDSDRFDRRITAALANRIENRGGRESWRSVGLSDSA